MTALECAGERRRPHPSRRPPRRAPQDEGLISAQAGAQRFAILPPKQSCAAALFLQQRVIGGAEALERHRQRDVALLASLNTSLPASLAARHFRMTSSLTSIRPKHAFATQYLNSARMPSSLSLVWSLTPVGSHTLVGTWIDEHGPAAADRLADADLGQHAGLALELGELHHLAEPSAPAGRAGFRSGRSSRRRSPRSAAGRALAGWPAAPSAARRRGRRRTGRRQRRVRGAIALRS